MAIQILGLREFFDEKTQKTRKYDAFFSKQWRAASVPDLFIGLKGVIESIPKDEQYNLYYTVADCFEEKGRKLKEQKVIPFDIDNIDLNKIRETAVVVCEALKVDFSKVGVVYSGHGIQVLIGLDFSITDDGYFDENRDHYKAVCQLIKRHLQKNSLAGDPDPSVFSPARLMRLPDTENRKPGRPSKQSTTLNGNIESLNFRLESLSNLPVLAKEDFISQQALDRYPKPDTDAVLSECEFLKWTKKFPNEVKEPQWYGMLSIVGRLSRELGHQYSSGHKDYNHAETDLKITQALSKGPRTCRNVNTLWEGCHTCPHNNTKLVSPYMIKGKDYIKTQGTGFHELRVDQFGNPKPGKPDYDDLKKYFEKNNPYVVEAGSSLVNIYSGSHWTKYLEDYLRGFAEAHFEPKPNNSMCTEFIGKIKRTNIKDSDWFNNTKGKMNFKNGVLDLETLELKAHSMDYGFKYCLHYDYDPGAQAPLFEKFLDDLTVGRQELKDVILEFAGYSFSGDNCWLQKSMFLVGDGANGKSTLLDIFKHLAGEDNYSSLTLSELKNDANRYQLDGKLFNLAEETSITALLDSSIFKNLATGGETTIKRLYHQPYRMKNKAKLMFACNELPKSSDSTAALFRRVIAVPFDAIFSEEDKDPFMLEKLKLESSGIFNLVVNGYRKLKNKGHIVVGEHLKTRLDAYKDEVDVVGVFKKERLEILEGGLVNYSNFITLNKVYESYTQFAIARGEKPLQYSEFFKGLKRSIWKYDERIEYKRFEGGRKRIIKGVKFVDETTEF